MRRWTLLVLVAVLALGTLGLLGPAPDAEAIPHCYNICQVLPDGTLCCAICTWNPQVRQCLCSWPTSCP